jgi:hypothetical protein
LLLRNPKYPGYDLSFTYLTGSIFSKTLGFGDSPIERLDGFKEGDGDYVHKGEWIVFILAMASISILIMNTLIAILGDSYDKVVSAKKAYETEEKLSLMTELNILFTTFQSDLGQKKWIHLFRYEDEQDATNDEWGGKIKFLSKMIQSTNKEVMGIKTDLKKKISNSKAEVI